MRLIDVRTYELKEFYGEGRIPKYAILSHTWTEGQEVSYQEWQHPDRPNREHQKKGYAKIRKACEIAQFYNLEFLWCDTVCINKESSADLSESINSMFAYYADAAICIAYLEDISTQVLAPCRWFTRGWTLQELLAPKEIAFHNKDWEVIGTKRSTTTLKLLSEVAGIDPEYLSQLRDIHRAKVAVRMSWASRRNTTRVEDEAYCLLGIFKVNMPLLYGEGPKAFIRLQEEIIRHNNDHTIFCWTFSPFRDAQILPAIRNVSWTASLAPAPSAFSSQPYITEFCNQPHVTAAKRRRQIRLEVNSRADWFEDDFSLTNRGINVSAPCLDCAIVGYKIIALAEQPESLFMTCLCLREAWGSNGTLWERWGLLLLRDRRLFGSQYQRISLTHERDTSWWRRWTKNGRALPQQILDGNVTMSQHFGILPLAKDPHLFGPCNEREFIGLGLETNSVTVGPTLLLHPACPMSLTHYGRIRMRDITADKNGGHLWRSFFLTVLIDPQDNGIWRLWWKISSVYMALEDFVRGQEVVYGPLDGSTWPPAETTRHLLEKNVLESPGGSMRTETINADNEFLLEYPERSKSYMRVRPVFVDFTKVVNACEQSVGLASKLPDRSK